MTDDTDHALDALDPGPSWLDDMLRAALTRLPEDVAVQGAQPAAMLDEIDRAIDAGWPQGHPLTLEELAADHAGTESRGEQWSGEGGYGHHWDHSGSDQGIHPDHVHDWHHHEEHSTDIDPDPGPLL